MNPPIRRCSGGESVTFENSLYPITRYGFLEDAYLTLCYSPLRNEGGRVKGGLVTVFERMERMRERR